MNNRLKQCFHRSSITLSYYTKANVFIISILKKVLTGLFDYLSFYLNTIKYLYYTYIILKCQCNKDNFFYYLSSLHFLIFCFTKKINSIGALTLGNTNKASCNLVTKDNSSSTLLASFL